MEIGRINFPEKGPMRGQYKYCIAKNSSVCSILQLLILKKCKRKVQRMPQSQTAALPRHQEEKEIDKSKKRVREKSMECRNHKPQLFPDTKRKRKPTNPNKHKSNKRTKSTKIRLALPSPSEVIAMLKGLKNTRTKWHKVRHKANRFIE